MDTGTLLIAIISVVIVSSPFVLKIFNRKKKEKHLLRILQSLADKTSNKIKRFDVCGKRIVGIDPDSGILFFYNDETPDQSIQRIELAAYIRSEVVINEIKVGANGEFDR